MLPLPILTGLLLMMTPGLPPNAASPDSREGLLLTDFTSGSADFGWYVVNDNVMGGRSDGGFEERSGKLRFAGRTNTRGGGFSSIRTAPMRRDLSTHTGILLNVKGDGRRYTWRLTTDARWRGRPVSYWADFATDKDSWTAVSIPFDSFVPKFRGNRLDGPPLDPASITGMGLMIYDGEDGAFELHLSSVRAYSARQPVLLRDFQWKNRVLVVSAANRDDPNLQRQEKELAESAEDFADRDMLLVTLLEDSPSRAGDRALAREEAGAMLEALDIRPGSFALRLVGKDGSVKLSAENATPMSEIYALIDTMPMRQAEKADR